MVIALDLQGLFETPLNICGMDSPKLLSSPPDLRSDRRFKLNKKPVCPEELRGLPERNLKEATFEDKADLVAMLGIKVYPAEDLKSRRIVCRLNLKKVVGEREQNDFPKVMFGGPQWTEQKTSTLAKQSKRPQTTVYMGIGWLAREDKLIFTETKGKLSLSVKK